MKGLLYDWGGINQWLFYAINNVHAAPLDAFMQLGTALGNHKLFWIYLIIFLLLAMLLGKPRGVGALFGQSPEAVAWLVAILTFAGVYLIDYWLVGWFKTFFHFPRPPLVFPADTIHLLTQPKDMNHSFPSGHAWFAATIAASLWPIARPKLRIGLVGFVLWVGISRVSLGAHFPADVFYGALFGMAVVIFVRFILRIFLRVRQSGNELLQH